MNLNPKIPKVHSSMQLTETDYLITEGTKMPNEGKKKQQILNLGCSHIGWKRKGNGKKAACFLRTEEFSNRRSELLIIIIASFS